MFDSIKNFHKLCLIAPSVYFLKPTPKHVHVYSNGDICLNLLGRDWRPMLTGQVSNVIFDSFHLF